MGVNFWKQSDAGLQAPSAATCASYAPGHQMHYIHQGQALRSPSERVRYVGIDGDCLIVARESGDELLWRHHDPTRLGDVVGMFPNFRVIYPSFHALRVGPYWFNCADDTFAPCEHRVDYAT